MKPKTFHQFAGVEFEPPSPRLTFADGQLVIARLTNGRLRAGYWLDLGATGYPVDARGDGIDGVAEIGVPS